MQEEIVVSEELKLAGGELHRLAAPPEVLLVGCHGLAGPGRAVEE